MSSMNTPSSSIQEWHFGNPSGNIAISKAVNMTEVLEGFAQRLRELLKQFQEVERLPDEDKNVVKKLLDAFLTKKQLQELAR